MVKIFNIFHCHFVGKSYLPTFFSFSIENWNIYSCQTTVLCLSKILYQDLENSKFWNHMSALFLNLQVIIQLYKIPAMQKAPSLPIQKFFREMIFSPSQFRNFRGFAKKNSCFMLWCCQKQLIFTLILSKILNYHANTHQLSYLLNPFLHAANCDQPVVWSRSFCTPVKLLRAIL